MKNDITIPTLAILSPSFINLGAIRPTILPTTKISPINANTNAAGNPNIACKNIFAENPSISATL